MTQTLLGITADMEALDNLIMEAGGDMTDPAVEAAIIAWEDELSANLETKVDNYAWFIHELEARATARAAESVRLADRSKVDQNSANALRHRMKSIFEIRGLTGVNTPSFTLKIVKNGGKLPLEIMSDIPPEYTTVKETRTANTEAIRAVLDEGTELPFARLGVRGTRLSIK